MLGSPCSPCCGPKCATLVPSLPVSLLSGNIDFFETGPCAPGTAQIDSLRQLILPQNIVLSLTRSTQPSVSPAIYIEIASPTFSGSGNEQDGDFVVVSIDCVSPTAAPVFSIQASFHGYEFGSAFPAVAEIFQAPNWSLITSWNQLAFGGRIRISTGPLDVPPDCRGLVGTFDFLGLNPLP